MTDLFVDCRCLISRPQLEAVVNDTRDEVFFFSFDGVDIRRIALLGCGFFSGILAGIV